MKSALLLSAILLAGCSVSQPVKTVTPVKPVKLCKTEHSINGQAVERMNDVSVADSGNRFSVTNNKNQVIASSPILKDNGTGNLVGAGSNGLTYSKGMNDYAGFYGIFSATDKTKLEALTFDCR